jgi:spermidine/putrescine ABC transporter ATP-binding subunit
MHNHDAPRPTLLRVDGITKKFGDMTALAGISLDVQEGEFLTLLGPSGCGKTTLIRIIAGFENPSSGDVLIDGKSVLSAPPYRRPLGMVFQSLALFPHLTVAENIAYGLRMRGTSKSLIQSKVYDALEMVGLKGFGERYIGQISGGQKQRVALARAIVTEPRVLLLDEPFGALDMKIRRQMQTELKQIQERLGTTFIFVTHDQEEALTMSDRIAVFRNGLIDQVDDPVSVYEKPVSRFVAEFVGDTNFFEAVREARSDAGMRLRMPDFNTVIDVPGNPALKGDRVGVSIRPEHLRLTRADQGSVNARVTRRLYAGQSTRFWLQTGERTLIADWCANDGKALPELGQTVGLTWNDDSVSVVSL